MIQRYGWVHGHGESDVVPCGSGDYVLYSDHLAALTVTEAMLERAARKVAAVKIGLVKDTEGARLPAELWRQSLPHVRVVLEAAFSPEAT